jgi:hypothetical protein
VAILASEPVDEDALRCQLGGHLVRSGAIPPSISITSGSVPSAWDSPHTAKEHHLRISVTREQALGWISRSVATRREESASVRLHRRAAD